MSTSAPLLVRAIAAVRADPVCEAILDRLPRLGLPDWWLTAGAVFQNVWNAVEGYPPGHGIKDYDVFYFDDTDLSWDAEDRVIHEVAALFADIDAAIEIRNQARVHLWYQDRFGVPARPFTSARDAIKAFASTTCCLAVTSTPAGVHVYAPHGLEDVFALHMRPNPRLGSPEGLRGQGQPVPAAVAGSDRNRLAHLNGRPAPAQADPSDTNQCAWKG